MTAPHISPVGVTGWIVGGRVRTRQRWRPMPCRRKKTPTPWGRRSTDLVSVSQTVFEASETVRRLVLLLVPQAAGALWSIGGGAPRWRCRRTRNVTSISCDCLPVRRVTMRSTLTLRLCKFKCAHADPLVRCSFSACTMLSHPFDSDSTTNGCMTETLPSRTIFPLGHFGFMRNAQPSRMGMISPVLRPGHFSIGKSGL